MSDEQTTCPNCGAPGEMRSMIGPEMKSVTRMRWLCGSTNLEGKDWPTEMCAYAASLRRERDAMRRVVEAAVEFATATPPGLKWAKHVTNEQYQRMSAAVDEYLKEQHDE